MFFASFMVVVFTSLNDLLSSTYFLTQFFQIKSSSLFIVF